jgi:hypothetical protein
MMIKAMYAGLNEVMIMPITPKMANAAAMIQICVRSGQPQDERVTGYALRVPREGHPPFQIPLYYDRAPHAVFRQRTAFHSTSVDRVGSAYRW